MELAIELCEEAKPQIDQATCFTDAEDALLSYKARLLFLYPSSWKKLVEYFESSILRFLPPKPKSDSHITASTDDDWLSCLF